MFLRIEGDGVEDSSIIVLGQYSGGDMVRCIGFDYYFFVGVEMGQDRGGGETVFQELEGLLAIVIPKESVILLSQGDNRCPDVAVSFHTSLIEVR